LFIAVVSPVVTAQWFSRLGLACVVPAIAVSIWIDVGYFHNVLGRAQGRAVGDVLVQRMVGWSMTLLYFLFTAVPKASSFLPDVAANVFGTRP
jgi:hypothetical protein